MGHIHIWAKIAALAPSIANFFSHAPIFENIAKFAADVHPNRTIPSFAPYTFKSWFEKRKSADLSEPSALADGFSSEKSGSNGLTLNPTANAGGSDTSRKSKVILWADTFNNHFHPQTAQAAVEVLEAAGFRVIVPKQNLCCGRPLYDWGMITEAKVLLKQILDTLETEIENGTPIVVLEPSCATVFKEELLNLFPTDENAKRLAAQTFLLSNFLEQKAKHFQLPKLKTKALLHGHCHQKSIFKMDDEEAVLKRMGVDFQAPETGCCGMAGAFGFEREHYDVSMKCGERVLLPAVRKAEKDCLIITSGFSCHEQIAQTTERKALHLAQVIQMALRQTESDGEISEQKYLARHTPEAAMSTTGKALLVGTGLLAVGGIFVLGRSIFSRFGNKSE
ncbi:MAG: (Fe-S)-binding protein [Pyrinomonadaceae bacterium]